MLLLTKSVHMTFVHSRGNLGLLRSSGVLDRHGDLGGVVEMRESVLPGAMRFPSAIPQDLLCNGFQQLTVIIGTNPMLQFCDTQLAIRFRNRALAMDPFGLAPIQPGALDRQGTHHEATAAFLLDAPVVRFAPRPHRLADVP